MRCIPATHLSILTYLKNLVTDKNYTGIFIEYGKWYAFSTSSVDDTSGSIGINYPGWSEGSTSE